jgi:hypothetical protein
MADHLFDARQRDEIRRIATEVCEASLTRILARAVGAPKTEAEKSEPAKCDECGHYPCPEHRPVFPSTPPSAKGAPEFDEMWLVHDPVSGWEEAIESAVRDGVAVRVVRADVSAQRVAEARLTGWPGMRGVLQGRDDESLLDAARRVMAEKARLEAALDDTARRLENAEARERLALIKLGEQRADDRH